MEVYEQNKMSLSPMDIKKWIAQDGITTQAYGHYLTKRKELIMVGEYFNELVDV